MNQFSPPFNKKTNPLGNFSFGNKPSAKLTDKTFQDWRQYIYDLTGIYFQDNKKYLLESRLLKRINHLKLESFEKYLEFIKTNPRRDTELKYLYEVITINETFFFRNQPQLDALVSSVIPTILETKPKFGKPKIRIWSAASSSGEEAYSTAIILSEMLKPKFPNVTFEIVGTDINYQVVETAKKGVYKEYAIRNTTPYYLKKYFKQNGNTWEISPQIKQMVTFKLMNLFDDNAMRSMSSFDVVFCANVLIYFDVKSKIKVVNRLYNSLNKEGYLFIGYSETLHGISKAFKLVSYPKTIGYKKE
ncbi:MAG: protein-glutamate O-methyltransferase CheR [Rhodothermaceae bacterium]